MSLLNYVALAATGITFLCPSLSTQHTTKSTAAAKPTVLCPVKPGKILSTVTLKIMPGGKTVEPDSGDDISSEWTVPPLRDGQHAVLECDYTQKNSGTMKPTNHIAAPVPAGAGSCSATSDPSQASCSKK